MDYNNVKLSEGSTPKSESLSHAGTVESLPDPHTGETVMPKHRIQKDKPKAPKQASTIKVQGKPLQ